MKTYEHPNIMPRRIELLAPAKNIEYGMAAIDHGADAVYIGAERFGARSAAGNSINDIRNLCDYAHIFTAKVYVTVNTIIYDNEINETAELIRELYNAGVDAVLIQDMGLLKADLPPIELHASTQTDNRTADKVNLLRDAGIKRVVLARELTLDEIKDIHLKNPDVELETFVHGALCVGLSGLCYASQYCFKRSANRGECAQFCRLEFDLEDNNGKILETGRHLLSLKDMCRYDYIEELLAAGVTSLKIEGRLKDLAYVKNVTAAYSKKLDEIISAHPGIYKRASSGKCKYSFLPDLSKTFNRGYTDYFLHGKRNDITSFDTPKSRGEYVGKVKEIRGNSFNVAGTAVFSNGDGLCFINGKHKLAGFRVNKAEGNRIFPHTMPEDLHAGTSLYRNSNKAFEKILSRQSSVRKIPVGLCFDESENGFCLTASINGFTDISVNGNIEKQSALKSQEENIVRQLTKLGNTPFECSTVYVSEKCKSLFIPSSFLAEMRRSLTEKLLKLFQKRHNAKNRISVDDKKVKHDWYCGFPHYLYNISNRLAKEFYTERGFDVKSPAFECEMPHNPLIMRCKHCIRYSLGHCHKTSGKASEWKDPLFLRLSDGKRFSLRFDCKNCMMNVYGNDE